jgi:hypothetical protein
MRKWKIRLGLVIPGNDKIPLLRGKKGDFFVNILKFQLEKVGLFRKNPELGRDRLCPLVKWDLLNG